MQQRHVNGVVVSKTWQDLCQRIAWPLDITFEDHMESPKNK